LNEHPVTESGTPPQIAAQARNRNGVVFVGLLALGLALAVSAWALPFLAIWLSDD
jgi:hypothetical protein